MGYEVLDHTGDIGIRIRESTLAEVFRTAARAMFELMIESEGEGAQPGEIQAEGEDLGDLMKTWLSHLLVMFFIHDAIPTVDSVVVTDDRRLTAQVRTRKYDPGRDALNTEIKAVTYHLLEVRPDKDGWSAQVIFDV